MLLLNQLQENLGEDYVLRLIDSYWTETVSDWCRLLDEVMNESSSCLSSEQNQLGNSGRRQQRMEALLVRAWFPKHQRG